MVTKEDTYLLKIWATDRLLSCGLVGEQATTLEENAKPTKIVFRRGDGEMTASLSCTEDERKGRGRPSAYKSLWRGWGGTQLSRDLFSWRQKLGRLFLVTINVLSANVNFFPYKCINVTRSTAN